MKNKNIKYYMDLNYEIKLRKLPDEEGGYVASIPELGESAFSGYGDTVQEALDDLNEVKQELFEIFIEKGKEIPLPKDEKKEYSGKILVRIPKYLHRELAKQSDSEGVSLNRYIHGILAEGNSYYEYINIFEKAISDYKFTKIPNIKDKYFSDGYKSAG